MKTLIKTKPFLFVLSIFTFASQANTVKDYQLLVEQWLNLNKQHNQLVSNWQNHKPQLEQRLTLLNLEKQTLEQKLSNEKLKNDKVSQRRSEILQQQSQLEAEQNTLSIWLEQEIRNAHSQMVELPPPLSSTWREALNGINETSNNSEALEVLLVLQSKRQEFNQRITFEKSKVTVNQKERLLEQLYFGETLAYISTPDGTATGVGFVKDNQWVWQLDNAIDVERFQTAKAMLQHHQAAEFLDLPIYLEPKQ